MNPVRSFRRVVLCLAALLLFSVVVQAQSDTASIAGVIHDPSAASIPNATIIVRNEGTGVERRATANENGYFVGKLLRVAIRPSNVTNF